MKMLNALILLLLVIGQFELMVAAVNRLHALRIRGPALRWVRDIHEVLIVALPLLLAWLVGVGGWRLTLGGGWTDLPWLWTAYLGLCALGSIGFLVSTARFARRRVPQAQLGNDSRCVDLAGRLGYRPLARGPYRMLAGLPGNEIFRIEVSDKTYRLPRLPKAWDGLSILHLTDLHLIGTIDLPFFEALADLAAESPADLIVFTGDLLDDQRLIDWLPTTLGRMSAPLGCYFILGNHDWYLDPDAIRRQMTDLGWHDVAGATRVLTRGDSTIAIGGTERPWMGQHPDFTSTATDAFRILLSHTPDNLGWARQQKVDLMLSGHNHGGQVVPPIVGPIYAPSLHGCRYISGAYEAPPTLLYVSRGISGRHPIRWRCPPELTRLILRSH
ncbi:MAG TPA: metallophosphoesterase [Pirellulales bacterium]|nr:metallophosphoesterase [Pirellulales bacterium]